MIEVIMIVGLVVLYFVLMVWWPEWVGITGKVGKKNEKARQKDSQADDHELFK